MADRVSASITLGGTISPAQLSELAGLVADEGLSTEWDGEPFEPDQLTPGEPLQLCAHEVPWGRFERLESWCVAQRVPFARWAGGYPGEWTAERVVFTGSGEPRSYTADEDDRIYVVDRKKDKILRGGEIVYCAEVEAALFRHPAVVDACAFGVPNERLGEEVGAAVQIRPDMTLTADEPRAFVAQHLAHFKIPRYLWPMTQPFPRNAAGKTLRRELRARLAIENAN